MFLAYYILIIIITSLYSIVFIDICVIQILWNNDLPVIFLSYNGLAEYIRLRIIK